MTIALVTALTQLSLDVKYACVLGFVCVCVCRLLIYVFVYFSDSLLEQMHNNNNIINNCVSFSCMPIRNVLSSVHICSKKGITTRHEWMSASVISPFNIVNCILLSILSMLHICSSVCSDMNVQHSIESMQMHVRFRSCAI